MTAPAALDLARVAVVGVHGHGASHVRRSPRSPPTGARCCPASPTCGSSTGSPTSRPARPGSRRSSTRCSTQQPDAAVPSTPIPTHLPLASSPRCAPAADALLEKPTTASLADHAEFARRGRGDRTAVPGRVPDSGSAPSTRSCGSSRPASSATSCVRRGRRHLGPDRRVLPARRVAGRHARRRRGRRRGRHQPARAWSRSPPVAGARTVEDVADVEVDLFHAHDIEADDTSSVVSRPAPACASPPGSPCARPSARPPACWSPGRRGRSPSPTSRTPVEVRCCAARAASPPVASTC